MQPSNSNENMYGTTSNPMVSSPTSYMQTGYGSFPAYLPHNQQTPYPMYAAPSMQQMGMHHDPNSAMRAGMMGVGPQLTHQGSNISHMSVGGGGHVYAGMLAPMSHPVHQGMHPMGMVPVSGEHGGIDPTAGAGSPGGSKKKGGKGKKKDGTPKSPSSPTKSPKGPKKKPKGKKKPKSKKPKKKAPKPKV